MNQRMKHLLPATFAAMVVAVTLVSAAPKFTSVWKSPEAGSVSFAGKKVAALVITQDDSLRVSGEEALVRELTARGLQSVATYRIAPKEELQSGDRAKVWFEKANVEGVVAMRPVTSEKRTTYTPGTWTNPYYSTLWGYYGYGWSNMYIPGSSQEDTVVVVETTMRQSGWARRTAATRGAALKTSPTDTAWSQRVGPPAGSWNSPWLT